MKRIKLLAQRYLKARKFGLFYFGARNFEVPNKIKLDNKIINLYLPNEYGIKISFIEIFLDDVYQLGFIKKLMKKKQVKVNSILDIGGNCGLTSLLSRAYFPNSIINCYEPNPDLKKFLENNSKFGNFNYFIEAVGNKSAMVKLDVNKQESILSNITDDKIGETKQVSFNSVLNKFNFENIDIVKMDCEGSEWEILQDVSSWKNVKFLTMEYHLGKNNFDHNRILFFLNKIGFKLISKLENSKKVDYGMALAYNPLKISI